MYSRLFSVHVDSEILSDDLPHDFDDLNVALQTLVVIHEETTAPNLHLARPKAVPHAAFRIFRYPFSVPPLSSRTGDR